MTDIKHWFSQNFLHLNESKTECILFGSKCFDVVPDLGFSLQHVRNLGVKLDEYLHFDKHIDGVVKASFFQLHLLAKVKSFLCQADMEKAMHAFISSRIDYCNALYIGVNQYTLQRLQLVQNAAARPLTNTRKHSHITLVLYSFHWLPVHFRIDFKLLMFVFKALHGLAPLYLCKLLTAHTPNRALRSASQHLLEVPRTKRKLWGDRSFSVVPDFGTLCPWSYTQSLLCPVQSQAKDSFVHNCLQLMTVFIVCCFVYRFFCCCCFYILMPLKNILCVDVARPRKRLTELLLKTALEPPGEKEQQRRNTADRSWGFLFYRSPLEVLPDPSGTRTAALRLAVNRLEGSGEAARAVLTGEEEVMPCGLVISSIGYKSLPIDPAVPFDPSKAIVPNHMGRVTQAAGLYVSGWLKTGPTGVIATTMNSSFDTARSVLEDMGSGALDVSTHKPGSNCIRALLDQRGIKPVTFSDWEKIDQVESQRGEAVGKPREKLLTVEEMLEVTQT
uniref:NADPH:adrenodoxin oxidoreductase, mitochondrial n=1 Tax=Periophthalmus magnuspinnatus TaxID=409849 RepID=A0A3B4AU93_9GOBI